MPLFKIRRFDELLKLMRARVVARAPDLTDIEDGSNLSQMLGAVARVMEINFFETGRLLELFSIFRARGVDLDARAVEYIPEAQERQGASRAVGTMRWTRVTATASAVIIPEGTRIARTGTNPQVVYVTTAPGAIPAGGTQSERTDGPLGDIPARAESAGEDGNALTDTVTNQLSTIAGVNEVTNPTPFTGGRDQEDDDSFRARIVRYVSSLARCTREALESRALEADLDGQKITTANIIDDVFNPGHATLYVDDGSGAMETFDTTLANEDFVTTATGGEMRFNTQNKPLREDAWTVKLVRASVTYTLTPEDDYKIVAPWGLLVLNPDGAYPELIAADQLYIEPYQYWTGLIAEAQRLIDGDPSDVVNYPTWVGEGAVVRARTPKVRDISVICSIVVLEGYNRDTVRTAVQQAITSYINALGIGDDVVLAEITERAMAVQGMYDVVFSAPTNNIAIPDDTVARAQSSNVEVN